MAIEYVLPGSVLLLKLVFRVCVDQRFTWIDTLRAVVVFPADVAFLSFSFGAATLAQLQATGEQPIDSRFTLTASVLCVAFVMLASVSSKASERAFDSSQFIRMAALSGTGYCLAALVLYWSLHVGALI